jgi:predicted NBD/HSP70 family sugar kinase
MTGVTTRSREILSLVRHAGPISRSRLIRETGLSGTAIFRGTEDLAARGLITIGDTVAEGRGQPSAIVEIRADAMAAAGLSVMTDRAEAALVDYTGRVRALRDLSVPGMSRAAILDGLDRFIDEEMANAGIPRARLAGLGLAVAGFFVDRSAVNPGFELDDWALVDLEALVGARIGTPVIVENLASASALGERLLGAGARFDNFAYIDIAAGFGAGIVVGGELVRGGRGNAGEVTGLFKLAGLPTPNLTSLRETLADHGVATASITDLVQRYDPAWPGVEAWLAQHNATFSLLAASLHYVLDCEAIIIGGRTPRLLASQIVEGISWPEETRPARRGRSTALPTILAAELPAEAATIGAGILPLRSSYLF